MVMFTISRDQALIIREFNDPPVSFYILELNNPTMVELRAKSIYLAGIRAQIQPSLTSFFLPVSLPENGIGPFFENPHILPPGPRQAPS